MFFAEIFRILTQTTNGWPDPIRPEPQKIDPIRVKNFWPRPITSQTQDTRMVTYLTTLTLFMFLTPTKFWK